MLEPLKLSGPEIIAAVETRYGISTAAFSFLPLGNDSATSVYLLVAHNGASYFVKVRTRAGFSIPSLAIPQFLQAQGVSHIVAPLSTRDDMLWVMLDEYALTLYPFIEQGRTAAHAGMTNSQWREFGAVVRRYHNVSLTPELLAQLPREQFIPKQCELIPVLKAAIERGGFSNDAERALAEYWQSQQPLIQTLLQQVASLGAVMQHSTARRVLCHADMHTYNVLMNEANEFWLVDWDEVILALPERDLMFAVGGIHSTLVTPQQTAHFLHGYGGPPLDPAALTYYRFAWAVQDMAAYGESVFLLADLNEETRHEAVQGFKGLFERGGIVEIAFESGS